MQARSERGESLKRQFSGEHQMTASTSPFRWMSLSPQCDDLTFLMLFFSLNLERSLGGGDTEVTLCSAFPLATPANMTGSMWLPQSIFAGSLSLSLSPLSSSSLSPSPLFLPLPSLHMHTRVSICMQILKMLITKLHKYFTC